MVIRFLLRYLSNNEHLVQKLSESYPMRRAAQLMVAAYYRTKVIADDSQLTKRLTPEQFRYFLTIYYLQHLL